MFLNKTGSANEREQRTAQLETIRASGLFNAEWYLKRYPDVAEAGLDPLEHFVDHGWQEWRDPNPDFAMTRYAADHPELAKSGTNPLLHFIENPLQTHDVEAKGRSRLKTKWLDLEFSEVHHAGRLMRFATTGSSSMKRIR